MLLHQDLHLSKLNPFLSGFPHPKIKVWCLCRGPPSTPRYGRLCPINGSLHHTASCRSFDLSKQPVFRYMGILPGCCSGTFRLLSVAFLSGPTASWANGDTFCLCRPSCLRHVTGRKESPFCLPGRPFLLPAQAVIHHFYKHPLIYTGQFCLLYLYRDYLLSSYLACRRVGFIRCECRLSRLILPFWSAFWRKIFLAGQEYFASKKRRMGCTDILVMHHKTPRRSGRKDPTRGKKKTKSQVMAGLTTLPQNIFKLCYTFTLSVASERIVRLSRVHTVRLLLLTWQ